MDLLNALDILIGLVVIYLVIAITCTIINEWIDTIVQVRARKLQDTIREMFGENTQDPLYVSAEKAPEDGVSAKAEALAQLFLSSSTVRSLYRKNNSLLSQFFNKEDPPTYLSAKIFREILFSIVPQGDLKTPLCKVIDFDDLQASIDAISNTVVKSKLDNISKAVQQTADTTTNKFSEFHKGVEAWYNEAMERTSDWYKRKVQLWTFVSGTFLCVALNVDTISLARYFSDNPAALEIYVDAAQEIARIPTIGDLESRLGGLRMPKSLSAQGDSAEKTTQTATLAQSQAPGGPPKPAGRATGAQTPEVSNSTGASSTVIPKLDATALNQRRKLSQALNERLIQGGTLPLGWDNTLGWDGSCWAIITKILGLIISITAVSAGAPFWFDTLSRVMNIRNSLKEITVQDDNKK